MDQFLRAASERADFAALLTGPAPFPKYENRAAWESVEGRENLIALAEQNAPGAWEILPAWRYMDFQKNGNRSRYEDLNYARRDRLLALALGECAEGKGRFIEPLVDGLWATLEETSWVFPAHNNHYPAPYVNHNALPDVEAFRYFDLFCAATAGMLAALYAILGDRLAQESPLIPRRIELELKKRVLDPYLERDDLHWMGLDGKPVNNWCPWINQNVFLAFLLVEKDPDRRARALSKTLASCQSFLNMYGADGGCDEGPGYFAYAGGCYLDLCEEIYEATEGKLNFFSEPLTRAIAAYQMNTHISGAYFVNYADAHGKLGDVAAGQFMRVAGRLENPALFAFGRAAYTEGFARAPYTSVRGGYVTAYRYLKSLFGYRASEIQGAKPCAPAFAQYESLDLVCARETENSDAGLFFSAKGGSNGEGHNHNDVGTYILYRDGRPVVIDAGVARYTAKTFSAERYSIWSMRSVYHNTLIPDGLDQPAGGQYRAKDARCSDDGDTVRFTFDFAGAYPAEAELARLTRTFEFERKIGRLTVADQIEGEVKDVSLPVMLRDKPTLSAGKIDLGGVTLSYDADTFDVSLEEIPLDDDSMRAEWERDSLHRLLLTRKNGVKAWRIYYERS